VTRNALWFLFGVALTIAVDYPMAQRQAEWEARTIACWPNRTFPAPLDPTERHP